jgi:polyhydroxyalkanoate synthesis regulator phasin
MTQRPNNIDPFDPFGAARALRDANIEAWSKIMQQWVNTEAYSQATNAMLDTYLTTSAPFRKAIEQAMTQVLTQFNMPTRTDVTSIAERLTNIEMRLDDLDAQLDIIRRAQQLAAPVQAQATEPDTAAEPAQLTTAAQMNATAQEMDQVVQSISETGMSAEAPEPSAAPRLKPGAKEQQP